MLNPIKSYSIISVSTLTDKNEFIKLSRSKFIL